MRLLLIIFIFGCAQAGLAQTNKLRKATSSNEIKVDLAYAVALEALPTNPFLVFGGGNGHRSKIYNQIRLAH